MGLEQYRPQTREHILSEIRFWHRKKTTEQEFPDGSEPFPRLREIKGDIKRERIRLTQESPRKNEVTKEQPQKETRTDGFKPFVNPEPQGNQLFVNGYNGNFTQQMELNRKGVERVLTIAHLAGRVILTSLASSRNRSVDGVNKDGSTAQKRKLFFGEKIEDDKQNPLKRVISIPEGWKIEINDTRIRENLEKRNLTGKKLQAEFIRQFNGQLKQGIWNCILKEKLTGVKDRYFVGKVLELPLLALSLFVVNILFSGHPTPYNPFSLVGFYEAYYLLTNILNQTYKLPYARNIDHKWEYLMPSIEIDKVLWSAEFILSKGKTLVREVKPEVK